MKNVAIQVKPNMTGGDGPLMILQDGMAVGLADNFVIELPTSAFGGLRMKAETTIKFTVEAEDEDEDGLAIDKLPGRFDR